MEKKLDKRVALVTGSTSGIGKAICERFAENGAKVIITGRREGWGQQVASEILEDGGEAQFCRADLTVDDDVENLVQFAVETYGGIDILVNNAGMVPRNPDGSMADGPIHRTEKKYWDRIWRIDLRSIFIVTKLTMPYLLSSKHACIINISSVHGQQGCGMDVYSAIKGAVISLTRSMAVSYGHRHVRVNCISPGMVLVERTVPIWEKFKEMREQYNKGYLTRMGYPSDIAEFCLYLASDAGEYVTGANFILDGGMSIHGTFPPGPSEIQSHYQVGDEIGK